MPKAPNSSARMETPITHAPTTTATVRKLTPLAYVAAVLVGLAYGFDVGQRISGPIVGAIMALNTAVFAVLCVSAVAGWVLERGSRRNRD